MTRSEPNLRSTYTASGSCVGAGFQGCCAEHNDGCLGVGDGECYCDQECYSLDDCCVDIGDICPPPGTLWPHV